jgi:hypothetical protein
MDHQSIQSKLLKKKNRNETEQSMGRETENEQRQYILEEKKKRQI